MRKYLLYGLLIICFLLLSCSNEDCEKEESTILPKALLTIYPENPSRNYSTTFVYERNKIVSVSNKFERIDYLYNENHIVSEVKYNIKNGEDVKYSETIYEYENDNLKTVSQKINEQEIKWVYSKNEDGSITKETYTFDTKNKKESRNPESDILTITSGNLTNQIYNWGYNEVITSSRYEYDDHYNAFKNVLGFKLLLDQEVFDSELNISSSNNATRHSYIPVVTGTIIFEPYSNTMKYDYTTKGYPAKRTTYDYTGKIINTVQYLY